MDLHADARLAEGRGDDRVALRVHMEPAVLVDRDDRRVARRVLQMLLHIGGQRVILRVGGHMQGMVAADDKIQVGLFARQHRRAGERHENFIDILGRRAGRGLLRAGLAEEEVEAAARGEQALVRVALKVKAGGIPLGVILEREHRLDLIRADPQIVAAVPGVELAGLGVAREVREIIARLVEQGVFRERAVGADGMVFSKKVDGGDGIDVHARVVQQIADVEAAGEGQIGPAAAVAVGIILLMRVERAAVPVVKLLPGEFRLFDVLVLAPAEIADAD